MATVPALCPTAPAVDRGYMTERPPTMPPLVTVCGWGSLTLNNGPKGVDNEFERFQRASSGIKS